ncbi:MAG: serine/threonine protein kinase [Bacteriovoracaceae bacterium]
MTEKKFQRFGKYLILDHLVDGGMAKICRARYLGEQANKVVAIKMVQPQFSNDDAFARMFQDELNITFGMLHPNIMQVYDYGKTNGQLYTAMEYIHGANLKQYLDRLKDRKVVFPVEISCYIISQVCLGLHYAHTFTDKLTGKPYNIVHRDISPHNIMLTYDGAVKVIDFGIAKANTNTESTQAGTIKGKLSYLAPEYLDGQELDARYDEFAVGITLWELLCSRKLFQANNDLAVLKLIQACKVTPPSQINPSVPKELDAIVMKALSKDRSQRYENLDQMNRALVKFLYSHYPEFNASDLKTFADDLFKTEMAMDKEKFVEYGKIDIQPYIEDLKREESKASRTVKGQVLPERSEIVELELDIDNNTGIEIANDVHKTTTRKLVKNSAGPAKPQPPKSNKAEASVITKKADEKNQTKMSSRKEMKKESHSSSPIIIFIIAASFAGFAYFQPELVESIFGINLKNLIDGTDQSRSVSSVESVKKHKSNSTLEEVANGTGEVVLRGVDISMEVFIDGVKTEYVGRPILVNLNQEITLSVKKKGHMPFSTKVNLNDTTRSVVVNIPELERARIGLLSSSLNYTSGSKLIYTEGGEVVERELPLKDVPITEGTYEAKIVNPILGTEKKVEFSIEENKKHFLE